MADTQCFNTIRLSASEIETLLAGLERDHPKPSGKSKRRSRRWPLRGKKLILTTADEASSTRHYFAFARNISAGGAAVLHGGFLHNGTSCFLTIRGVDGKARTLKARVMKCNHLQRHLHDVGLRFETTIDPRSIIDFGDAHVFTVEHVDLGELKGAVLVVEDNAPYRALLKHYFRGSPLEFTFVSNAASAMECLAENPAMIFADMHLPDKSGLELIADIRAAHYEGPIIMLTADTTPGLRTSALKAGANEMLIKPCPPEELHSAAAEFLLHDRQVTDDAACGLDVSTPAGISPDMLEMFVQLAEDQAAALAKAISDSDIGIANEAIRQLCASADGYGFKRLGVLARDAGASLEASNSVSESVSDLNRLIAWCRRAASEHSHS